MLFEACFEPSLQLSIGEKSDLLRDGFATYLFVDGEMAGETYGCELGKLDEEIEDCEGLDARTVYCYSTCVLPAFRGKGLAKVLKAFWLGTVFPRTVVGHATSDAMRHLVQLFGATLHASHTGWYGTKRVATFYTLESVRARAGHKL